MLKTVRISEASWRVIEEHSKDLKVWREELRTIAGSRTRKAEPPPEISAHSHFFTFHIFIESKRKNSRDVDLQTWRRELFEGSCAGSSRVVWNKKIWASVEKVDI